jgi:ankyrin repeat protein
VYCQVVYICGCIPARIQHALADLPDTLDGTYERTLREINKADWEFAHRLFQFVAVASRPLRVEELAELLAYDFKAGPIPKFHEGWRLENPTDAVLSTCSSLLAIVDGYVYPFEEVKLIQFSHFSVKEYLTSTRLAEATDIIPRRYHVSMTPAHTLVAQACFGILLHLDKDVVTRDSLEKWPLAQYAAKHWADHTRFEGVSQNVEDCLRKLFDPRKPHLAVCVWIHNPDTRSWLRNEQGDSPSSLLGTPLHYAALWGFQSIVEFLVTEHSQNVHSRYFIHDETPLDLASSYGHLTAVHLLIERGADVAAQNEHGETSLHLALTVTSFRMALKPGQVEVARMLIERGADVVAQNKDGDAPLHLASRNGQVEVACMLIERGADVAAQNKRGFTPLHLVSRNGQVEVARMLIERGADVAAQNKDGEAPLHLASRNGEVEVARMLIERGADVAAQNKDGETPLHLVWLFRPVEVARMLIERGADVAAQNKDGFTSLHMASRNGEVEVARMLIERGADLAAQNKYAETPLHLASRNRPVEVARMLIERGADVAAQNEDGETPLHVASVNGEVEVARMLIECGADVAAQNKDGETPLHLASRRGEVEVARMLIERGADVAAQNKDRETALHLASRPDLSIFQQQGLTEVSLLLLEHGADVNAKNKYGLSPFHLASQCWLDGDRRQHILRLYGGMMDPGYGTGELEKVSPQVCLARTRKFENRLLTH